ncbi:MAG: holo-ACP synthase [Acidobacteriota bacterium]|nr:holo-ACP synthase [Acidobacteriota bacterium]
MAILVGLDLTPVSRVAEILDRFRERFLARVFVDGEIRRARRHPLAFAEHVAGRFAAKEATMKALGTGWRGIAFREIAVLRDARGKPTLDLRGRAAARAKALGVVESEVSITHTADLAAAVVVLVTDGRR